MAGFTQRLALACVLAGGLAAPAAHASLTPFQTFSGHFGVSTDGFGSTSQAGTLSAFVPAGATVKAAYLYTSTYFTTVGIGSTLAGTTVSYSTLLGETPADKMQAARADVTGIVKPLIDGGPGGTYNLRITEASDYQDGEALVVVWELGTFAISTVAILDGFSDPTAEFTRLRFSAPLDPTAPGFAAELRLGIGFSYDGTPCGSYPKEQASTVQVNGTAISTKAGCNDDSEDAIAGNGNLITVGGSDDPYSAMNPTIDRDHERYNLAALVNAGDTDITVQTSNPSLNDNIFLAVFQVSGTATVGTPPAPTPTPTPMPEPAGLPLVAVGLAGLVWQRRTLRRATWR